MLSKRKKVIATLYTKSTFGGVYLWGKEDPKGYLFSEGRYHTKILPSDLPKWYVNVYIYKRFGYISAKNIKHLLYVPNYSTNHLYKDDILLISYDEPIEKDMITGNFRWYKGYNHLISGPNILDLAKSAAKYSDYDITNIISELEKKKAWFDNQH